LRPIARRSVKPQLAQENKSPAQEAWAPLSAEGFPRTVKRAGVVAKLGIKAHAHMLRHANGFKLANDGIDTRALQAYFGHSNIQNTARYTELALGPFKNFWRD
jgi:site-specific recombinase XerD